MHGAYAVTIEPNSHEGTFRTESYHKGKLVTIALDEQTLEKLWHDIAHLNGALKQAAGLGMQIDGFFPTLPDKHFLKLFADWDRLNPSNP